MKKKTKQSKTRPEKTSQDLTFKTFKQPLRHLKEGKSRGNSNYLNPPLNFRYKCKYKKTKRNAHNEST